MKKFRVCPRCDKKTIFSRWACKKCGLVAYPKLLYTFKTNKYTVTVREKDSVITIEKTELPPFPYLSTSYEHRVISKLFPPKATDEDIEKLLVLMT